ncbi:hypothetical protein RZA67_13260 [Stenotrophomonas sp. C3(2023)]|nr:hypothetical protein [Stenotrophomonas sp. C3(2023)]
MNVAHRLTRGRVPRLSVEALLTPPNDRGARALPEWLRSDMDSASRTMAPELDPTAFIRRRPLGASAPVYRVDAGHAFAVLRSQLRDDLDTLFLVPDLAGGDVAAGALHYVRACVESFGHSVAVMATEARESPWAERLPAGVAFIDAGRLLAPLDSLRGEQVLVLSRLLLQARPKRIHLVNSRLGWQSVATHAAALRGASRLYATLFCNDLEEGGAAAGSTPGYLRDNAFKIDAVIADGVLTRQHCMCLHPVPPELFNVVHFPVEVAPSVREGPRRQASGRPSVLWASSVGHQPPPELVLEIARRMPDLDFDVHVTPGCERRSAWLADLASQVNVTLQGPSAARDSIIRPEHAAVLYTCGPDEVPSVMLEPAVAGLPILVIDPEGVSDLSLVKDVVPAGVDVAVACTAWLRGVLENPAMLDAHLRRQTDALSLRRWGDFVRALEKIPFYSKDGRSGT